MRRVKSGLEVLLESRLSLLRDRRIGLVTNHSAVTGSLTHILDALLGVGVKVIALYAAEHGIRGDVPAGKEIPSGKDPRTGIPIFSLYGLIRQPTPEMLGGVETIIFDIQDIGARFYTYANTMSYVMQACAKYGKRFIVLDRPNPINGLVVDGNILDRQFSSIVGLHPIPIRHGMTVGELASYFNSEFAIGTEMEVVTCHGWKRSMFFDETGLPWVMPSPNMPTVETAIVYPGLCLLEGTNVSEGRGTNKPFEILGAPWIDSDRLADCLNKVGLPGAGFRPAYFIPTTSKFANQQCGGVQVHIMDRDSISPVRVGLHVIKTIRDLYPEEFQFLPAGNSGKLFFDMLMGTDRTRVAIQAGVPVDEIIGSWYDKLQEFMYTRKRYFLYL